MTTSPAFPSLAELAPIGLAELTERAELQTRVDRKYLLPIDEVRRLLARLDPRTQVLSIDGAHHFAYESVYFDTPDLTSYRLTAQRRRRRFKVRTRAYLDSALCWLEVKTQGARGVTVKHRQPYQLDDRTDLSHGRQFLHAVLTERAIACRPDAVFTPTLVTRYRRSTLFLPDPDSRVTIDTELTWEYDDLPLHLPQLAIVETKTGSTASGMDRLLWAGGHRPIRISKYATGLAALRPDLPAAPWRRTLRRHFSCPSVSGSAGEPASEATAPVAAASRRPGSGVRLRPQPHAA